MCMHCKAHSALDCASGHVYMSTLSVALCPAHWWLCVISPVGGCVCSAQLVAMCPSPFGGCSPACLMAVFLAIWWLCVQPIWWLCVQPIWWLCIQHIRLLLSGLFDGWVFSCLVTVFSPLVAVCSAHLVAVRPAHLVALHPAQSVAVCSAHLVAGSSLFDGCVL